ncbi:MAG: hypothetical protein MUF49_14725 [Oculatellaceae cyanobacterium Prado106]|jgi:hypothetical protein|nr:hypothetical protein [Oculatellaceae cyanobacterium Prado106]
MLITLELSPEQEAKLRKIIATRDAENIRLLLADAFIPTVEALLQHQGEELSLDEFEKLADQISEEFALCFDAGIPLLSDAAVSRAGIYEDHP